MDISGTTLPRRPSRSVTVSHVAIGGGGPVVIQSMTNTQTADAQATLTQVRALAEAGAQLVRVATPMPADTAALAQIVAESPVPIVADVHFHFERALEAIAAGVAKIRLNPGNLKDRSKVERIIDAASEAGAAIRVGVNEGSIVARTGETRQAELQSYQDNKVELMVEKLAEYLDPFEKAGFDKLVLSAKSHDAVTTIAVNRAIAARWDWPMHLGVTHAGTAETGAIRSAAALGSLLADGIGDTIRISFAGDPVAEVAAAKELLACLHLRPRDGVELIACPTCGRLQADLEPILNEVENKIRGLQLARPLTVAIMGCVVNGPGEADGADLAICAAGQQAILYRAGKRIGPIQLADIPARLLEEIQKMGNA